MLLLVSVTGGPPVSELVVQTSHRFSCPASKVWPLLCDSRTEGRTSLLFLLGVPQPLQCRLPDGHGEVGAERECQSDRGTVHQRILEWLPEQRLSFRMEETTLPIRGFVDDMVDTIELLPVHGALQVTRTTSIRVSGQFRFFRRWLLYLGVKQVHHYVFRSWARLASSVR